MNGPLYHTSHRGTLDGKHTTHAWDNNATYMQDDTNKTRSIGDQSGSHRHGNDTYMNKKTPFGDQSTAVVNGMGPMGVRDVLSLYAASLCRRQHEGKERIIRVRANF